MKFTPSNSVSSSTTNSSLSDNFCKSKGHTFGCFAGVLSRILCSKSLPTHPSDPIECHKNQHLSKIEKLVVDGSATPNVVARLMGLDSMPEINFISNSIPKSKSFDSEDFRAKTEDIQGQHRRVKTSVSFRETSNYFELEDDDFFVLSFENGGKSKKKGSNSGHNHRKRREKYGRKQRRNRNEQSRDRVFSNEERLSLKISPQISPKFDAIVDVQKQSYHLSPLKEKNCSKKDELDGNKAKKKKSKEDCLVQSKVEAECDSDNSSPVSVLDHSTEFISDPEVTTSEEDARLEGCESVSRDFTSQNNESCEREINLNEERNVGLKRRDYKKPENIEMLRRICRLAEAEVNNSNWKYRRMLGADDLEGIAKDFGQGIFDQLISELVDQIVGLECHEY
ncbi:Peptidyl-tRNA hydrolase [Bienertia sinuspersici]